jgi:6-phosphogluconolactonase
LFLIKPSALRTILLLMSRTIEVLPNTPALIDRGLAITLNVAQTALQERGKFTIALAGGSTPEPLYAALAQQNLDWENVHVFWGDERYVAADHPDSNAGMAHQAWLDHVSIPSDNIHAVPTHFPNPETAAVAYEQTLLTCFQVSPGQIPSFDLILLGMGPDGHTASLFPHTPALQVCDHLVTVGSKDGEPRITFTLPLLNQAAHVVFLVAGANKQVALREIFASEGDSLSYPARFVQPTGELMWLLDQAAATGLNLNF